MKERLGFDLLDLVELVMASVPYPRGVSPRDMAMAIRRAVDEEDDASKAELLRYLQFSDRPGVCLKGVEECYTAMWEVPKGMLAGPAECPWLLDKTIRLAIRSKESCNGELIERLAHRASDIIVRHPEKLAATG